MRILAACLAAAVAVPAQSATLEDLMAAGRPAVQDAPSGALVIAGEPAATIVVRERPTGELLFAAETLQSYLRQMTGASLPVATDAERVEGNRVLLGLSNASRPVDLIRDLDDEGYALRSEGRDLIVCGGTDRGTVFGVAALLHRLGVRWYVPGDDLGTCVPETDEIVLTDLDERHEPSFPMRWVGRNTDWAILNGQNCPGASLDASFKIEPSIYHTQNRLLPHREHFPEHPEYYALVDGERSESASCKLCYSNPDVAPKVAAAMAALKAEDPAVRLLSFSPTDGQLWCECSECVALDEEGVPKDQAMSRRSLLFYNEIAKHLRLLQPDAEMLVGAYNVYNWPPRDRAIEADPMLSVIITHYQDYCMAHPIADRSCPLNRRYVELIEAWDRLGTPVYYYEYYWKVNWLDLPWPIVHCIERDMRWFHERGDRGVYTQFNPQNAWTLFPAYYMAARLLWDVETDVDAAFDEMCDRLFGAGGPAVREYYRLLEDAFAKTDLHFPGNATSIAPQIFTDELLAALRERLDRADGLADSDLARRRLAKLELSYEYTTRLVGYLRIRQATDPLTAERALRTLEELMEEIRYDRGKWNGIVSTALLGRNVYLGRELEWQRKRVAPLLERAEAMRTLATLDEGWRFRLDSEDVGVAREWFAPGLDDADWEPIEVGKPWEDQGHAGYDGFAWYRLDLQVQPEWLEQGAMLHFGAVDGEAWVYLGGDLIGHHEGWDEPFAAPLKGAVAGENVLAVRVWDGGAQGGIWKPVTVAVPEE